MDRDGADPEIYWDKIKETKTQECPGLTGEYEMMPCALQSIGVRSMAGKKAPLWLGAS